MTMANRIPWDAKRLNQVERQATACPSDDACRQDVLSLVEEVRRLRRALRPFAGHSLGGYNALSNRRLSIRVTEGQLCRAWMTLEGHDWR